MVQTQDPLGRVYFGTWDLHLNKIGEEKLAMLHTKS